MIAGGDTDYRQPKEEILPQRSDASTSSRPVLLSALDFSSACTRGRSEEGDHDGFHLVYITCDRSPARRSALFPSRSATSSGPMLF